MTTIYLANGCFWCTESVFTHLEGVSQVVSGYAIGRDADKGLTHPVESAQITYDPEIITYDTLLDVFFYTHDPTQLNRQGPDIGAQYRSAILYTQESEKVSAEKKIKELTEKEVYEKDIVTTIEEFVRFKEAEEYHQDFYNKNRTAAFCVYMIDPKLEKLKEKFGSILKK